MTQNIENAGPVRSVSDAAPRDATANLLLAACGRFSKQDRPSREECDLFREAFYASIQRLDTATRQNVATLLAHTPYCPRPIALFLAMDVPAVAHPMLRSSPVLTDRDLSQIVSKTTPIHVRLLATRANLSAPLLHQMAAFDDADIHRALLENATLEIDADLRTRLEPKSEGPLRNTVQASATATNPVEDRLRNAIAKTRPTRQASQVRTAEPLNADTFRSAFEAAAMRRDRQAMVRAMRSRFGLAHHTAIQALDDRTGDALQVMMKAGGFDGAAANRIVMLAIPAVGLSLAATERALQVWDRLKVETCQAAFANWPREERPAMVRHETTTSEASGVRQDARTTVHAPFERDLRQTG